VTHHLPVTPSIASRYQIDPLNPDFASRLAGAIETYQPDQWIHGHTHVACDYEICSIVRKTVGLEGPLKIAVEALPGTVHLALIYGSIAKRADTSASDVDLLIVADDVTLEDVYTGLVPAEELLDRKVNPTLYTSEELERRSARGNAFLKRVLSGPVIVLSGTMNGE
jgi:predicted nucleotidyltransferase